MAVAAVAELPLRVRDEVLGSLNTYSITPWAFGPTEQLAARGFADEASRALELALRVGEPSGMSAHLQAALVSRAVTDQAVGVTVGQHRCTVDEAFELLRGISQNRNVKLRAVAAEIVTSVSGQPSADEPRFS